MNALLGDIVAEPVATAGDLPPGIRMLPVGALTSQPGQPRRMFDDQALEELAQSIATRGVLQPILVRPHGHNYQIVAGERRWRAAQRARLHEVPVIVRDWDDADTFEIALLENIQRRDLNAIEEAEAYQRLIGEFGHTQDALARLVHKSRSHISNLLRLLDLPESVRTLLIDGQLDMGHARALLGAPDIEALAQEVVAKRLSVREAERLAQQSKRTRDGGGPRSGGRDADLAALERQLSDVIGLGVRVTYGAKGGTLTINYSTLDQLDMVCQRLTGDPL